jgi:hypothetical protein
MKILRLFSKRKSQEEPIEDKNGKLGAALVGAGLGVNTAASLKVIDLEGLSNGAIKMPKLLKPDKIQENEKLTDALIERAKKDGLKIEKGPYDLGGSPQAYLDKTVYIDSRQSQQADSLAHELGHAHYDANEKASKVGKAAHKAYFKLGGTNKLFLKVSPATAIGAGVASGIHKAKKEAKGEKEGKLSKVAPYLAPTAIAAPALVSEAMASHKGMKLLKKAGASKKDISASRRNLAAAALTYGTMAAMNAGIGGISKHIAYKKAKKKLDKNKED